MDDQQFFRLLDLFPRVRSASYCEDNNISQSSMPESSSERFSFIQTPVRDGQAIAVENGEHYKSEDIFWTRLRASVEEKLGPTGAASFCSAFKQIHHDLIQEASSETIRKILKVLEKREESSQTCQGL